MTIIFTICSNNYLAQATVLGQSLAKHNTDIKFFTILVDEYNQVIDYSKLPFTCIAIKDIEPDIETLMERYDIIELNTCVKPHIFQYFFSNYPEDKVVFFDPDIQFYDSLSEFDVLFETNDILLTPHILSPIEMDGQSPDENRFLNFGIYNLGFIALQRSEETMRFLSWWKERTYLNGYSKVCDGIFVDQLYINLVPIFFKGVYILMDPGYNMAPWNLHERHLTNENGRYIVNDNKSLKFFHFSSFRLNSGELPLHYYTRFSMAEREDLRGLFADYNNKLAAFGYQTFNVIKCVYLERYKFKKRQQKEEMWNKEKLIGKIFIKAVNILPASRLNKIVRAINYFK